jgi:DNA-3-methyladenine glycosylase II
MDEPPPRTIEQPIQLAPGSTFDLHPHPPYRLDFTVWALRRRPHNEVDRWDGSYRRALLVGDRAVGIRVVQVGGPDRPILRVEALRPDRCTAADLAVVRAQVVRLLGVDADLREFYALADADPRTSVLKDRFLGLRPPRFPGLFEALANAVANQQLSLEVGLTLLNRLTMTFGVAASEPDGLIAFPTADAIVAASPDDLRRLGFSARKAEYLQGTADAVATGALDETTLERAGRAGATRDLVALRGVGRWSAEYVLLRGLGRLDVYPGDDVGARNKLRHFLGLDHDPGYDEIAELLRPWQPASGLLYFHLLLDGLAERGELDT